MVAELIPIVQTHQLSKIYFIPLGSKSMQIYSIECQNKNELSMIRLD